MSSEAIHMSSAAAQHRVGLALVATAAFFWSTGGIFVRLISTDLMTMLFLRGIFGMRHAELSWYYQEGASWLFPDKWERFLAPIPENERGDLIAAYRRRLVGDDAAKAALQKQIEDWQKTAARYRSEPETGEGTEQLAARAKHAEHDRDLAMARYHHYEVASAAFQIGIVLASATIITGMIALAWISGLLALAGVAFTAIGLLAPHAVHLPM